MEIIEKIKKSPRVIGIFTTGTTASTLNPSSDIDLIIILEKNDENIKSVYTTIDGRFADVFFFDIDFLKRIQEKKELAGNDFDGIFVEWLLKGKIGYDPENLLTHLKESFIKNPPIQKIEELEKQSSWIKINYNFITNNRYYGSNDLVYHQALELRLLYSVIELITAYFTFRDMPWRGEKNAVKYFKNTDSRFFEEFLAYTKSTTLDKKMKQYRNLFQLVFSGEYKPWPKDFVIGISKQNNYDKSVETFWKKLCA